MIIRLSGANFSANKLETITLHRDVSPETLAILANYTRVLTQQQKLAVDDFLADLVTEGIWPRIENLYIPALANDVTETLYNVKKGSTDAVPSATYYEMHENGLKAIGYTSSSAAVNIANIAQVSMSGSLMGYHYGVYVREIDVNDTELRDMFLYTPISGGYRAPLLVRIPADSKFVASCTGTGIDYSLGNIVAELGTFKGFIGFSSGQDKIRGTIGATPLTSASLEVSDTVFTNSMAQVGYNYAQKPSTQIGMNLISTGLDMTAAQLASYNTLCDTLMDVLVP